mgnify:CR=1 FL=1
MGLRLPESRFSDAPQPRKRQVPIEAIIATMGNNPYAKAIDQIGPILSLAIQKRAELRKRGQELAALEQIAGQQPGAYSGLSNEMATSLASSSVNNANQKKENLPRIRLLEQQGSYKPGELGDDFETAKLIFQQNAITKRMMENPNVARRDETLSLQKDRVQQSIVDKFNADTVVRKQSQSIAAASSVRELVNSDNPIAASAIPTYMARASGEVGNLSEPDKAPFGGSQAILSRLEAALTQKATGRLTQDNAQFLIQLSDVMEQSAIRNMDRIAQERAGQYSKTSKSLNKNDIYNMLRPTLTPLPTPGQETPQQRKARLLQELSGAR